MVATSTAPSSIQAALTIQGEAAAVANVLDAATTELLVQLHRRFNARRLELLDARRVRQARFDAGELPDFLPETRRIREGDWKVAPLPPKLLDRRIEITGPVDAKMIINALNSGANVFMADFEDSSSPTFANVIQGQANLQAAVRGELSFTSPEGKHYALKASGLATLMVRPRGWHLSEKHVLVDGERMSGGIFDLAVFAIHNAKRLASEDRGPYFYLPKMQSHLEAQLWDEVMSYIETRLVLPIGTMKATVLIETLPAVFEMDEILHALKSRIAGLNCGRWDYVFSYIKTFRKHPNRCLPERGQVTMTTPFLKRYSELLIQTCHRRGALAMGGMAAQIPINHDPEANAAAMAKVRADKLREVTAGHDGTWVAHPGLIPIAREIFDAHMPTANQLHVEKPPVAAERDVLIDPPTGTITRTGFLNNIDVCVRYIAAWLDGLGCVPIHYLMEDAATAEISRAQLWQWLHVGGQTLDDGTALDFALFDAAIDTIDQRIDRSGLPGEHRIDEAAKLLKLWTHAPELIEFLTLPCYERLA
ncbi:malate synthase A [Ahniella affigens]|uniref:malate synthase n=1 Tax=Ahniella affigens TaxID=2021234 RepID=A0A2P1PLN1_9GAMM|nr:malate synthase A [Ahniella affigens]AVP95740.1 malate synthase A [Ahniella affigens]